MTRQEALSCINELYGLREKDVILILERMGFEGFSDSALDLIAHSQLFDKALTQVVMADRGDEK